MKETLQGKKCCDCKNKYPLSFFYNNRSTKDGLHTICKECSRLRNKEQSQEIRKRKWLKYYIKNKEKIMKRLRDRFTMESEKIKRRTRRNTRYAISIGKIIKPLKCQFCLLEKPLEAHHEDYRKPLRVTWLCKRCHNNEDFGKMPLKPLLSA